MSRTRRRIDELRHNDAEISSAREVLFLCRGKLSNEVLREKSKSQADARRLADLELVISQLRDEIDKGTGDVECAIAGLAPILRGFRVITWGKLTTFVPFITTCSKPWAER
jgi:hypothetical protein